MRAIDDVKQHIETPPDITAARSSGFRLILETGRSVTRTAWATAAGISLDRLDEILDSARAKGRVELAEDGSLLGVAGLTVKTTPHRLEIEGMTRHTWCALDAVGILGALEADGQIHSTDPGSGEAIVIPFTKGVPHSDASLFILGGYDGGNVVDDWCPLVNFFATPAEARVWVDANGLEGDIVSVASVAEESAEMWRPVVDPQAPQIC